MVGESTLRVVKWYDSSISLLSNYTGASSRLIGVIAGKRKSSDRGSAGLFHCTVPQENQVEEVVPPADVPLY